MSPCRSMPTQSLPLGHKPYTKPETPSRSSSTDYGLDADTQDWPGFPTYAQYKAIETRYLDSLCPKRQPKALISQALFNRIRDALTTPVENCETAQFRFWVRKMFRLGGSPTLPSSPACADLSCPVDPTSVFVLHDDAMVAVQEKIYPLLCYFHGMTKHAGRDKTNALVRQHYSWVPKDLIAQFVKICPTCKSKRRGRGALPEPSEPSFNVGPWSFSVPFSIPFAHPRLHRMSANQQVPVPPLATEQAPVLNAPTGLGLHSLPMSREVSLYRGLPNGWQFNTDYVSARAACIESKTMPMSRLGKDDVNQLGGRESFDRRPRIPSIAPMSPPTFQELMDTYLVDDPGDSVARPYLQCIDPALLSSPLSEQESGSFRAQHSSQGTWNDRQSTTSSHTLSGGSDNPSSLVYLTPDLFESAKYTGNYDSPTNSELPTPQDELVDALSDGLPLMDSSGGYKDGPAPKTIHLISNDSRLDI